MPASRPESPARTPSFMAALPTWLQKGVAYGVAAVVLTLVGWLVVAALLKVGLVAFALLVALLLTALLAPLATRLCRVGVPSAVAALLSILLLIGVPVAVGFLVYSRVRSQLSGVGRAVTQGVDDIRNWLAGGPLALDPSRIDEVRGTVLERAQEALPSAVAGTATLASVLTGVLLVIFTVFFLVKDGEKMWGWALSWVRHDKRDRVDGGGRVVWSTLTGYVRGTLLVALSDAVGIGAGLLLLGVPVWLSLALLTFLGAFVPIIGATVAGAVAILVTLVTNGFTDALIVLAIVLAVQQLEGNVLQPLIMGSVVRLHPLAIITAVACGTLLLGIAGAVLAVPLAAVAYRLVTYLSHHDEKVENDEEGEQDDGTDPVDDDPERTPSRAEEDQQGPAANRGASAVRLFTGRRRAH